MADFLEPTNLLLACSYCNTHVAAKVLHVHESQSGEDPPFRVALVECPMCNNALVAGQELFPMLDTEGNTYYDWDDPARMWPKQDSPIHWSIPEAVRGSLEEAKRCLKAKAFIATAVMCGRALEATCHHFGITKKPLAGGLQDLLERGLIDQKIFDWGNELRDYRNAGAHPSTKEITHEEATELIDFALAIADYVFVLTRKFERFKKAKAAKTER